LLGDPARQVTDIAFAWGFGSLSSFYRGFQSEFGMSPGDLRRTECGAHRV
jgi:AraC-like DNA-binding protein